MSTKTMSKKFFDLVISTLVNMFLYHVLAIAIE
jgi:hypothetical protein